MISPKICHCIHYQYMSKYVTVSTTNTWDTKYVTVSNTWARKDTVTLYFTKYTLCSVPRKGRSQFLHLPLGRGVPAHKGLGHGRQENQALPHARLLIPVKLPLVGMVQGEASSIGSPGIVVTLRGVVTFTSMAASLPPVQLGTRTSAGRRSLPGRRKRPSFTGPRGLLQQQCQR